MMRRLVARLLIAAAVAAGFVATAQAQNCSGQPPANTVCAGPASGGSGPPSFRPAPSLTYTATGTGAVARTLQQKLGDLPSFSDFGADPTGATDATAALQNAVNLGGIIVCPAGSTYLVRGSVTVTKSGTTILGGGGNLGNGPASCTFTSDQQNNDILIVNAWNVTIDGANFTGSFSRYGTGHGRAIVVGTDSVAGSDGLITGGTTFSSAASTFTSADVGKRIDIANGISAGVPCVGVITAFTNSHTVTVSPSCGNAGGYSFRYGNMYSGLTFNRIFTQTIGHSIGIHIINGAGYLIDNSNIGGFYGAQIENEVAPDTGDSYIRSSGFNGDTTNGYGIEHLSGGGLKLINNIFGSGKYSYYSNWLTGGSGNLIAVGNKFEGYDKAAMFFSGSSALAFTGILIEANRFGGGGSGGGPAVIGFDSTLTGNLYANVNIVGNLIDPPAMSCGIDIEHVTNAFVANNTIKGNGTGTGICVGAGSTGVQLYDNPVSGTATPYSNAFGNYDTVIVNQAGAPPQNAIARVGSMDVWQRLTGTGGSTISQAASATAYTNDGWYLLTGANQASTLTQVAGIATNSVNAAKVQRNSGQTGTGTMIYGVPLFADELQILRGQYVTVSFTIKAGANFSPSSGNVTVNLYCGTASPAKRAATPYTGETQVITSAPSITTSALHVVLVSTIKIPANCAQMELQFSWAPAGTAGADDSFTLDDVQVQPGQQTYPFLAVDYQTQIAKAQRVFRVLGGNTLLRIFGGRTLSTSTADFGYAIMPPMESAPTVTMNNPTNWIVNDGTVNAAVTALTSSQSTADSAYLAVSTAATLTANRPMFIAPSNANATVYLSSEL